MASNRIGRINEEIQRELASLLRNLKDPRVQSTMISITRVETTPDLRYAKVYVSFLDKSKGGDALKGAPLRRRLPPPGAGGRLAAPLHAGAPVAGGRLHHPGRPHAGSAQLAAHCKG